MTSSGVAVTPAEFEYDGSVPESSTWTSVCLLGRCCCGLLAGALPARSSRPPLVSPRPRPGASLPTIRYGAGRVNGVLPRSGSRNAERRGGWRRSPAPASGFRPPDPEGPVRPRPARGATRRADRSRRRSGTRPRPGPGRTRGPTRRVGPPSRGRPGRRAGRGPGRRRRRPVERAIREGELLDGVAEKLAVCGPNSSEAPKAAGSIMFCPPRPGKRLPPTNATSARPQAAPSSPIVSRRITGGGSPGFEGASPRLRRTTRSPAAPSRRATSSNRSACLGTRTSRSPGWAVRARR